MSNVDKRKALGKGLESLLGPKPAAKVEAAAPAVVAEDTGKPREIALTEIVPSPYQTRQRFDEVELKELAQSITASGVVQPILVRKRPDGIFELIAGERRWRASKIAGKETIPAVVRQVSDEQAMEITIVENLQRADLNPMEQARAFERLSREFKLTQEQISVKTGKERASIGNFMRLLKLPREVQERVETGELSFGHARALLALESQEQMIRAAQKVVTLNLSVRGTENFVKGIIDPEAKLGKDKAVAEEPPMDPNVREAQEALQRALGLRVRIEDKFGKGRVVIEYTKLTDFDALFEMLTSK